MIGARTGTSASGIRKFVRVTGLSLRVFTEVLGFYVSSVFMCLNVEYSLCWK